MVNLGRRTMVGALAGAVLLLAPLAVAAKCNPPSDPNVEMLEAPAYMIDGVPVTEGEFDSLSGGDIMLLRLLCRDERNAVTGDIVQRQTVVWVVTTLGYESALSRVLQDLVTAQESFRAKAGRYTAIPEELSSPLAFAHSAFGGIRLTVSEGGWSASVDGDSGRSCHIAVGTGELPRPGLISGVPACFPRQGDSGA